MLHLEVTSVYHAKVKYAHPDGSHDLEEKRISEQRTQRLNLAYEAIEKARRRRGGRV